MYRFHAHVEYINTFSDKSSASARYITETFKKYLKKEQKQLKREFLI